MAPRHTLSVALSNESVTLPARGFADGVELEETFPEPHTGTAPAPAPAPIHAVAPAPTPIRFPQAPIREGAATAPAAPAESVAPRLTVVRDEPASGASEAVFQERLERRLREAEALVKQTIESVRHEEEKRLAEWARVRREEEERRLAAWADERRVEIERSMVAERQRVSDEARVRAWRSEIERGLKDRTARGEAAAERENDERATVREMISSADSVRDVGRIVRDAVGEMTHTAGFALSLHHDRRDEVAYRYRIATDDAVGELLRRDALDDGPQSAAAHMAGWLRAHRTMRAGDRNVTMHTAQLAIRAGDATIGVLTLQSEGGPIADSVLAKIADLAPVAAPRLAELRATGRFRGA